MQSIASRLAAIFRRIGQIAGCKEPCLSLLVKLQAEFCMHSLCYRDLFLTLLCGLKRSGALLGSNSTRNKIARQALYEQELVF